MLDLFTALALAIALEGTLYALFPSAMKRMLEQVQVIPINGLRIGGVVALAFGVLMVWAIRSIG